MKTQLKLTECILIICVFFYDLMQMIVKITDLFTHNFHDFTHNFHNCVKFCVKNPLNLNGKHTQDWDKYEKIPLKFKLGETFEISK